jgi:hypothetical protein
LSAAFIVVPVAAVPVVLAVVDFPGATAAGDELPVVAWPAADSATKVRTAPNATKCMLPKFIVVSSQKRKELDYAPLSPAHPIGEVRLLVKFEWSSAAGPQLSWAGDTACTFHILPDTVLRNSSVETH